MDELDRPDAAELDLGLGQSSHQARVARSRPNPGAETNLSLVLALLAMSWREINSTWDATAGRAKDPLPRHGEVRGRRRPAAAYGSINATPCVSP